MEKRKEDQEDLRLNKQTMFKMEVRELKTRNPESKQRLSGTVEQSGSWKKHGRQSVRIPAPGQD